MGYLLGIVIVVAAAALLGRAFLAAQPATLARGLRWGLGIVGVAAVILLIATEQLGSALALLSTIVAILLRGKMLLNRFRMAGGPSTGQVSEVETDYLRMTLDHETGTMSGTVRRG